jgi:hypothetical protein
MGHGNRAMETSREAFLEIIPIDLSTACPNASTTHVYL